MKQSLDILAGEQFVLFLVSTGPAKHVVATKPDGFAEGLRAANDLLSFLPPVRVDPRPEELFPWTGNV